MKTDHDWLESYAEMLVEKKVLELGCGPGIDTAVILRYAEQVVACDQKCDATNAVSQTTVLDHSQPLPFENGTFDTVVASLCLHYFTAEVTRQITAELVRVLKVGGGFVCRVNSTEDVNHGATGYAEIEQGLYLVNGSPKRFFAEEDVRHLLLEGFSLNDISHVGIDRYQKTKYVWQFSARVA